MDETRRNAEAVLRELGFYVPDDRAPFGMLPEKIDILVRFAADAERRALERAAAELEAAGLVLPIGNAMRGRMRDAAARILCRLSPAEPKAEPAGGGVERPCDECRAPNGEHEAWCIIQRGSEWAEEASPPTHRAGTRPAKVVAERQRKRARAQAAESRKRGLVRDYRCADCGEIGHNRRACTKPECAECKGDGWQRTRLADGTLRHGPMACPACTKPDEPGNGGEP